MAAFPVFVPLKPPGKWVTSNTCARAQPVAPLHKQKPQVAKNFMKGCGTACTFLTVNCKSAVDISKITFYGNEKERAIQLDLRLLHPFASLFAFSGVVLFPFHGTVDWQGVSLSQQEGIGLLCRYTWIPTQPKKPGFAKNGPVFDFILCQGRPYQLGDGTT